MGRAQDRPLHPAAARPPRAGSSSTTACARPPTARSTAWARPSSTWRTPAACCLRGDQWLFGPEAPYERVGDVADVVFPCGLTLGDDADTIHLYYGAADTSICLATASLKEVLDWLKNCGSAGAQTAEGQGRRMKAEGRSKAPTSRAPCRSVSFYLLAFLPSAFGAACSSAATCLLSGVKPCSSMRLPSGSVSQACQLLSAAQLLARHLDAAPRQLRHGGLDLVHLQADVLVAGVLRRWAPACPRRVRRRCARRRAGRRPSGAPPGCGTRRPPACRAGRGRSRASAAGRQRRNRRARVRRSSGGPPALE